MDSDRWARQTRCLYLTLLIHGGIISPTPLPEKSKKYQGSSGIGRDESPKTQVAIVVWKRHLCRFFKSRAEISGFASCSKRLHLHGDVHRPV